MAQETATRLLVDVGTRLPHTQCVARQAADVAANLDSHWPQTVVAAAWLHDIGYSPLVVETGLHPLDGARWARAHGFDEDVCRLIAWHTGSIFEAVVRGLERELRTEFHEPPADALDVLTWADLTSSPIGQPITPNERITEILSRYEPEGEVHRAVTLSSSTLLESARRVEQQKKAAGG
jgi:hypothetical protein